MITRVCRRCKQITEEKDLVKDKSRKDGIRAICYTCSHASKKALPSYTKGLETKKRMYHDNPVKRQKYLDDRAVYRANNKTIIMLSQAQSRAKKNNTPFDIDLSDIILPEYCPLLNIKLDDTNETKHANSPSLDRINNTKGYVKGNVAVISSLANTMKSNASYKELEEFAKNILNYLKPKNKSDE